MNVLIKHTGFLCRQILSPVQKNGNLFILIMIKKKKNNFLTSILTPVSLVLTLCLGWLQLKFIFLLWWFSVAINSKQTWHGCTMWDKLNLTRPLNNLIKGQMSWRKCWVAEGFFTTGAFQLNRDFKKPLQGATSRNSQFLVLPVELSGVIDSTVMQN